MVAAKNIHPAGIDNIHFLGLNLSAEQFNWFFYTWMKTFVYCIALCSLFSNFMIAVPFTHVEPLTWYSLDVFAV